MKVTTMTASHAFGKGRPDPSFSSAGILYPWLSSPDKIRFWIAHFI